MSSLTALCLIFFFETGSLTELRAHQFHQTSWLASPRDPPMSPTSSSTLQAHVTVPGFLCGCSGLNSGPLACVANISQPDHFPGLCCSTFVPCTLKKSWFPFHLPGMYSSVCKIPFFRPLHCMLGVVPVCLTASSEERQERNSTQHYLVSWCSARLLESDTRWFTLAIFKHGTILERVS